MDRFEEIAELAIDQAEEIECDLPVFRDGLKSMIAILQARYELVNDECET